MDNESQISILVKKLLYFILNKEIGKLMRKILERAFSEASQLSGDEQNRLAKRILAEIESEHRWNELFNTSQEKLGKLAEQTLAKHHSGETERLDPGKL